jgi:hypothetical protein
MKDVFSSRSLQQLVQDESVRFADFQVLLPGAVTWLVLYLVFQSFLNSAG